MAMISDEQLDYKSHIAFYENIGGLTGDPKRDRYWYQQAEYLHALSVCDAVLDTHIKAVSLAQEIGNTGADFQLRFGVARRAKFIWLSLRNIIRLMHPEREEPLLRDQVEEAARDLNVIYINIRGALDNFAWVLVDLFGDEKTRRLRPIQISLFGEKFLKDRNLVKVAEFVRRFSDWNSELKGRRDPAAHQIPLSVPPALIDEETRPEFERVHAAYVEAFNGLGKDDGSNKDLLSKFERVDALFGRLERIGKFVPLFVHHPDEGAIKVYPTVPADVGQLVRIGRGLIEIIKARKAG
jgi:hypothetical protein